MKLTHVVTTLAALALLAPLAAIAQADGLASEVLDAPAPTEPSGCSGMSGPGQPVDAAALAKAFLSDLQTAYAASDAVVDGSAVASAGKGAVDRVRFWGISREFKLEGGYYTGFPCSEDNTARTPFRITFYADAGGRPGAVYAVHTAAPIVASPVLYWNYLIDVFEYEVPIAIPVDGSLVAWIGIERETGADPWDGYQCHFYRVAEANLAAYDNRFYHAGYAPPDRLDHDLTYCLNRSGLFVNDFEAGDLRFWSAKTN